jgi:isopenicillin N synthase-like dioxygenase
MEFDVVPVDLTPWFEGGRDDREDVARQIDEACASSGFLGITGHGIPQQVIDDMFETTTAFFELPVEEKMRFHLDDVEANRGYAPLGSEALSYSLGIETPPDLFEAFNMGRERPPAGADEKVRAAYFSPNVWPDDRFRAVWLRYWDACERLGFDLVDIFAVALGMPEGYFRPFVDESISVMRANWYQRQAGAPPVEDGQLRMGAHSDYGCVTILAGDQVPGLQIRDTEGAWHDVQPPDHGFLVNLGDLLAEWTNDRWRATVHRVVPPPGDQDGPFRRRSVAWFQQPNHDALIEVLPTCISDGHPAKYRPITSGEHMMAKLVGPRALETTEIDEQFLH